MWSVMHPIFSAIVLEQSVFRFNDQAERGDDRAYAKNSKSADKPLDQLKLASP
jgi:hypothetical protein